MQNNPIVFKPCAITQKANIFLAIFLFLLLPFFNHTLQAQCTMACNGTTPETANQASMLDNCSVKIVADDVLEGAEPCMENKTLRVHDSNWNLIVEGENSVILDGTNYLNEVVSVTVIDEEGTSCYGYLAIQDKLAPQLDCSDVEVLCNANTSPEVLGKPTVVENCNGDFSLTYTDEVHTNDCENEIAVVITRTWQAEDMSGNKETCTQLINLRRAELNQVIFPEYLQLECDAADTSPENTGFPSLSGKAIRVGSFCNFTVTKEDEISYGCEGISYQIARHWVVTNQCTGLYRESTQTIRIEDMTPPVFTCSEVLTFGTNIGTCTGSVRLPELEVIDNCSNQVNVTVLTSYGAEGFALHSGVEVGIHTATYTAIDACGNRTTCEVVLKVEDNTPPQVICDDELNISIIGDRQAVLHANTIAENTRDNCESYLLYTVARMSDDSNGDGLLEEADFDSRVIFDCDDIGQEIMVVIRATQASDPTLFSECMTKVTIEDKIRPVFVEIEDLYVDCQEDLGDLETYNLPEVVDNCDLADLTVEVSEDFNNCGLGEITRTFTATDKVGNTSKRTQIIFVENNTPFILDSIIWPEHHTFMNECDPNVEPDALPIISQRPIINGSGCNQLAANYRDEVFVLAEQACFEVLRHWQVIDWCAYNPAQPEEGGVFTHTQLIKVVDMTAPEISCTASIMGSADNTCTGGVVNAPRAIATDCSSDLIITNDSPYATENGADASGIYPVGTTTVTFTAEDKCGNQATCSMTITVADDKAPTAYCESGLIANLMPMNGSGMIMVEAELLNAGSEDNCTAKSGLIYTIRRKSENPTEAPTTTSLLFTCDEIGSQAVEFWVTDVAGNSSYCETIINIQDNSNACPNNVNRLARLGGSIYTEDGQEVQGVKIQLENGQEEMEAYMTDVTGSYMFADLIQERDYMLKPERTTDITNGISTFDLIVIRKHILGIEILDSPYKMIAADVNDSGSITTLDLIALRKLILQIVEELPEGMSAWRFIPADYEFINPSNPCVEVFPELQDIDNLTGDYLESDFIGIKMGDVNNSAIPNDLAAIEERYLVDNQGFLIDDYELEAGKYYQIPIQVDKKMTLEGFQLGLNYLKEKVEITGISAGDLVDWTGTNYKLNTTDSQLTISWNGDTEVDETSVLFYLDIAAKEATKLSEIIELNSNLLSPELYKKGGENFTLNLDFNTSRTLDESFELYQNRPNPFTTTTVIGFELKKREAIDLQVFDVSGKVLYQYQNTFDAGYHEMELTKAALQTSGMLYYQLSTATQTATKKMVISE